MMSVPTEEYYWQWLGYIGRYGGQGKRDADTIPVNKMMDAADGIEHWIMKEKKRD